eukprot:GHVL01010492.1.p1 GENE.GHVL01010492.1~~GHVL01010492.1.p1  ORF type:complete len:286 (+),score=67.89 GHVL01010492.1:37-894(+)
MKNGAYFSESDGSCEVRSWPLQPGQKYVIGRNASADIPIEQDHMSRLHAVLVVDKDKVTIQDKSVNGTWINSQRVKGKLEFKLPASVRFGLNPNSYHISVNKRKYEEDKSSNGTNRCSDPAQSAELSSPTLSSPTISSPTISAPTISAPTLSAPIISPPNLGRPPPSTKSELAQKRKMLWAKGKDSSAPAETISNNEDSKEEEGLKKSKNSWESSFSQNTNKRQKFLRLMGAGIADVNCDEPNNDEPDETDQTDQFAAERLQQQLEKQFIQGVKRRDGRKTGLGL